MFVTTDSKRTRILEEVAEEYSLDPDELQRAYEAKLEADFEQDIRDLAEEWGYEV